MTARLSVFVVNDEVAFSTQEGDSASVRLTSDRRAHPANGKLGTKQVNVSVFLR